MSKRQALAAMAMLTGGVLGAASAHDVQAADAARGRVLYDRHCATCHAPGVHGKTPRTPASRDELRGLVAEFSRRAGLKWTAAEVENVVEHLETMSYRHPGSGER